MPVQRRGAAVEIQGLRRVYGGAQGDVVAIDHVDLRVSPGEFLCIVGPSGCGKSTLLRILAGLDRQSAGTIKVDAAGWAVENAMVFQDSGLFPWMSVEKNVRFGLDNRGVARDEANRRVEAALISAITIRINCPVACGSGAPLRVPSSPIRACS
jgi:ABC-type Fe3+/spermidine/putrescine transport system ATPase subunit